MLSLSASSSNTCITEFFIFSSISSLLSNSESIFSSKNPWLPPVRAILNNFFINLINDNTFLVNSSVFSFSFFSSSSSSLILLLFSLFCFFSSFLFSISFELENLLELCPRDNSSFSKIFNCTFGVPSISFSFFNLVNKFINLSIFSNLSTSSSDKTCFILLFSAITCFIVSISVLDKLT